MCTAITYRTNHHYFGRNLDLDRFYGEHIAVTPRNYPFFFRSGDTLPHHHAMVGMAHMVGGFPLYYEAVNERGLGIAGLNFPHSAVYHSYCEGKRNIASFELIPWLLGSCADLPAARCALENVNLWDEDFSPRIPDSPLHWFIADKSGSLVVESTNHGLRVYDDPIGVLTNEPPYPFHRANLTQYMTLSAQPPRNTFSPTLALQPRSFGVGGVGLPGDISSVSRFIRAAFTLHNSVCDGSEEASVAQFFHILASVAQTRGCAHLGGGAYETTLYSCCCNTQRGIYYYTTCSNPAITAVDMHRTDLDGDTVTAYPLRTKLCITQQN